MAKAKKTIPVDEKLENTDLNMFQVLEAIDRKDYGFYDKLSPDQQKKFVPFTIIQWMSAVKASSDVQKYYLCSVEHHANKHLFNYMIASKDHSHPKMQWLMLCAASPGIGKQFHQWIPRISDKISLLVENANQADTKEYFKKIYPKENDQTISEISTEFVKNQKRKVVLAKIYPTLKIEDIELLSTILTDDEINQYARDSGN